MRSNQGTLIHQKPLVQVGDKVEEGSVLADGSSTDEGELALGKNLLLRLHVLGWLQLRGRDHPLGAPGQGRRAVVRAHPRVRGRSAGHEARRRGDHAGHPEPLEESLRDLDDRGIVRIGAEVGSGDLLVGKVTPKGETELTAEEKLIRAIFKEKAREVRDTSLKVPPRRGRQGHRRQDLPPRGGGDELNAGVNEAGARLRRQEAQDRRGRQARRPARQQGRDLEDRARGGHAVPRPTASPSTSSSTRSACRAA